ncbi:MAG: glycosyltransferase [Acidobacteria bacterium]|nr:MAG: glycosyltransferase [Acidobacteriota bacterium]
MLASGRIPLALFLTSFSPGGTERQMIELLRRLDRRHFAVHLVCFHRTGEWRARAEELAESVTEFPVGSFRGPAAMRQAAAFARWCRTRNVAIVHTCDLYANIFGLPAAALAGVPVRIANRRELNPDKSAAQIAAQRLGYGFASRIVANSEAALCRLQREGVRAGRVSVIPNGIDLSEFRPEDSGIRNQDSGVTRDTLTADSGIPKPVRRVVTVARFRPEKGLETFIDAARLALAQVPDLEFALAGDGPLSADLESRVRAANLESRVRFLGLREDVAEVLRAHDVFVLPSRSEAFPNAVLEAMATALPIVATRVGGVPELIEHGRSGLLVAPGRAADLAAAIIDLVRRPSYARALGARARADAESRYSFGSMVRRFEQLYLAEAGTSRWLAARAARSSQPLAS